MMWSTAVAHRLVRWERAACTLAVTSMLSLSTDALDAQEQKGVRVCVGVDRLLRYEPGETCPSGQKRYRLAEVEDDIKAEDEDKGKDKEIAELKSKLSSLTDRLSALERTKGVPPTTSISSRVFAPFEVLDKSGNSILRVTESPLREEPAKGARVLIARGASDNYGLFVRTVTGLTVAGLGVTGAGAGGLYIYDSGGNPKVVANGNDAISLFSAAGKEVAALSIGENGNGKLTLSNSAGQPIVTASMLGSRGVGVVIAGPGYKCGGNPGALGLGLPDCIVGRPPQ